MNSINTILNKISPKISSANKNNLLKKLKKPPQYNYTNNTRERYINKYILFLILNNSKCHAINIALLLFKPQLRVTF